MGNVSIALLLAAFGVAPFAIFGAFGSPTDALLGLFAGLSFGLLAAILMESTTGNKFLDAFGVGAMLTLLGSVIGYDGVQLILIALLQAFAFAIAMVMPSRVAGMILTGLLTSTGFIFFDPTEFTIMLGDIGAVALKAGAVAVGLGLVVGVVGLVMQFVTGASKGSDVKHAVGWIGAGAAWLVVIIRFVTNGHHGFYGDRLIVIMKAQADLSDVSQIQNIDARRTIGSTAIATGQTEVSNSGTTVAVAQETRKRIVLVNQETTPVYIGAGTAVSTSTGLRHDPGASVTLYTTQAIYTIASVSYTPASDDKVHYIEEYDS